MILADSNKKKRDNDVLNVVCKYLAECFYFCRD